MGDFLVCKWNRVYADKMQWPRKYSNVEAELLKKP